jgi:DNA-binding SARP family transcriptional activator/predicted ATPase
MADLRIRLLGAFQASIEGKLIQKFESNKVRALLTYLVVESSQPHARESLIEMFWPEVPPKRGSSNLSQALYNLSQVLNTSETNDRFLLRSFESVQFNPECDYWLDVEVFNRQFDLARKDGDLAAYQEADQLYQGDFLSGFVLDGSPAFDEWLLIERHRLQRRALLGLGKLAQQYAQDGDLDAALRYSWRQVELDPLNETATRQLMRLLEESGQRSQALTQFERLQVLLSEELDILPEQETIALRDKIRGQDPKAGISAQRRDNLPAFLTPLVGRQRELAELQDQLSSPGCRLLTILGPGGSGKSRLALEAARLMRNSFPQGLVFVPLNPVQSVDSILGALLEALDLTPIEQEDPADQLINYLRGKQILLVLDGFEHLLAGSALVLKLLQGAGGFKLLVTSRMRLNLKGEYLYPLNGMGYPPQGASLAEVQDSDAVQLLIHTLRHADPGYQPDATDLVHLHRICQQVLGMPLGILLAASWGGTLAVEEIAGMVGKSLDLMAASWDDLPARQRSLRATFEYTWNLLSERQQAIFQAVSVFRGPFTRQAARSVSGATPYELRELVERSLLLMKSPGWYELHELLRQYGRKALSDVPDIEQQVCCRHTSYYLGQLASLAPDLKGGGQIVALGKIDLDHENYRAAWNWAARSGDWGVLQGTLESFCLYYDLSLRFQEGESACRAALDGLPLIEGYPNFFLLRLHILIWQSRFTRLLGQPAKAYKILELAKDLWENIDQEGHTAQHAAAFFAFEEGNNRFYKDRSASIDCFQRSLQIYHELDDGWGISTALSRLGLIAHHTGNYQEAVEIYTECLELNRILGAQRSIAITLINLGQNLLRLGSVEQAEDHISEGVAILQQVGNQGGIARGYFELARFYFWIGDFIRSCQYNEKAIPIFNELGMLDQYIFASIGLGLGLSHRGKYFEAINRVVDDLPLAQELDSRREIGLVFVILGMAYLGRSEFEQAENSANRSAQQYRNLNQQEELCLALAVLVYIKLGLDQYQRAVDYLHEILQIGLEIHGLYPILYTLYAAALMFMVRGKNEKALEIAALAERYPFVAKSVWFEDIAGRKIESITETLQPEVVNAAQERGRKRDIWETARELQEEFQLLLKESPKEMASDIGC